MDFKLRIYQSNTDSSLDDITDITLSNITIITKDSKFDAPRIIKSNANKFKYTVEVIGKFHKVSGSNSYPIISFKGEYIDILVRNFPRYPAFAQDKYYARNWMNGYTTRYVGHGYPAWTEYRKFEIFMI